MQESENESSEQSDIDESDYEAANIEQEAEATHGTNPVQAR